MGDGQASERARLKEIGAEAARLTAGLFAAQEETLLGILGAAERCLRAGGTIFFCGNGGSAADAQHLATELLIRLRAKVVRRSLPAMVLGGDATALSAAGNDFGFEQVFARPLSGLGRAGDLLIALTTSGRSANVIEALKVARAAGIATVGLLGGTGGPARALCDIALIVPSDETARIQELHMVVGHAILELLEERLLIT